MGKIAQPLGCRGNANQFEQFNSPFTRLLLVEFQMGTQRLHDLESDGKNRIQRCHGILKYKSDIGTTHIAQFFHVELEQVHSAEIYFSANNFSRRHGQKFEQ